MRDSRADTRSPAPSTGDNAIEGGRIKNVSGEGRRRAEPLADCVERAVECYFDDLDGEAASELYDLVLTQMEAPLLKIVMRRVDGNQSRAAEALGLNRGTLRKKLKQYGLL